MATTNWHPTHHDIYIQLLKDVRTGAYSEPKLFHREEYWVQLAEELNRRIAAVMGSGERSYTGIDVLEKGRYLKKLYQGRIASRKTLKEIFRICESCKVTLDFPTTCFPTVEAPSSGSREVSGHSVPYHPNVTASGSNSKSRRRPRGEGTSLDASLIVQCLTELLNANFITSDEVVAALDRINGNKLFAHYLLEQTTSQDKVRFVRSLAHGSN